MTEKLVGIEDLEGDEQHAADDAKIGPWEKDAETGRALVSRSLMMPPRLWALAQAVSRIEEKKGASALARHALVLYIIDAAQRDPRIVRLIYQHGMQDTLGVRLPEGAE